MFNRSFAWHPYLFALFPILLLYSVNAHQVALGEIVLPILIALCGVAIITGGLNLFVKNSHKSSIVVTVGLLWFFSWGHILDIGAGTFLSHLDPLYPRYNINLLVFTCLSLGLVSFLLYRTKKSVVPITRLANKLGLLLVAIQIFSVAWTLFNQSEVIDKRERLSIIGNSEQQFPDIYYLIVDGYGRSDILKEMYNYDNQPFISHLQDQGFYVAEQSNTNYAQTLLSLTSSMNMNLLDQIAILDTSSFNRVGLKELLDNNQLFEILRANGYQIASFEPLYDMIRFKRVDIPLRVWFHISEFGGHLIETTPLPFFISSFVSQYQHAKNRLDYVFEKLPALPESQIPRFVFAHFLCPHPPFVFDSTGVFNELATNYTMSDGSHWLDQIKTKQRTSEDYRDGYLQQIKYFTNRLTQLVDEILEARRENPPVIIIQADHGPGSELDWSSYENTNIRERMSIFNAYFLPGINDSLVLYPAITPVNSFRVVLNQYLDADLPLVPDNSYFSEWDDPFIFYDVTDQVSTHPPEDTLAD